MYLVHGVCGVIGIWGGIFGIGDVFFGPCGTSSDKKCAGSDNFNNKYPYLKIFKIYQIFFAKKIIAGKQITHIFDCLKVALIFIKPYHGNWAQFGISGISQNLISGNRTHVDIIIFHLPSSLYLIFYCKVNETSAYSSHH